MSRRKPDAATRAVDAHVGTRLRRRRESLGLSLRQVEAAIGLGRGTLDRAERGHTSLAASQLYELTGLFDVDISYFFDGLAGANPGSAGSKDRPDDGEVLQLARYFVAIESAPLRRKLLGLARATALVGGGGAARRRGGRRSSRRSGRGSG